MSVTEVIRWVWLNSIDFVSIMIYPVCKILGKDRIRILLYHRVCDSLSGTGFSFYVTPMAFAQQMKYLSQNGFYVITLDEVLDYKDRNKTPPLKTVIITFDDGYADNYINAFPILEKYSFKATFFIVTDYVDGERVFEWLKLDKRTSLDKPANKVSWLPLTRQYILDMQDRGASFGSHTKTHRALNKIGRREAIKEIENSKECLEEILSKPIRCFSYPYGEVDERVEGLVKDAGYEIALVGSGTNTMKSDFLELRRIEIQPVDSLYKFKRKVNGAYDWLEYIAPMARFMKVILSFGRRRSNGKRIDL